MIHKVKGGHKFWKKVNPNGPIHPVLKTRCWLWVGAKSTNGYGNFYSEGKWITAHRYSYAQNVGPIRQGFYVCHHCDNPPCVRPDHLYQGTNSDNVLDSIAKGRNGASTHPEKQVRGMAHHEATVTPEGIERALRVYAKGDITLSAVVKMFGLKYTTLWQWISGSFRSSEIDPKLLTACQAVAKSRRKGGR